MKYEKQSIFLFYNYVKNFSFLLKTIFIFSIFLISNENDEIRLVIKGQGSHQIFSSESLESNYDIFINEVNKSDACKKICNFTDDINNVTIRFYERNYSCFKMFYKSHNISEIDLTNFDTSKVTNMSRMFCECWNLTSINFNNINTSLVSSMYYTFFGCKSLTSIDLSYFDTSNVITMENMFKDCENLKSINLSQIDFSSIENINSMFQGCNSLEYVDFSNYNPKKINTVNNLFLECRKLNSIIFQNFNTSLITDMSGMFCNCTSLENIDTDKFNTSKVEDMSAMFGNCSKIQSFELSSFDTSNVKNFGGMFYGCYSLIYLDLSNFDTSNALDIHKMFHSCSNLESINISSFDTSKVTTISAMFYICKSLKSIDVSNFNTSNVIDMHSIFTNCAKLTSINLTNFDTSKVTSMFNLFSDCTSLLSIDLSNFDTSNVTDIRSMFKNCVNLTSLNLSNFNTINFTKIDGMFSGCTKLESLDISNFNISNAASFKNMFKDCFSLKYLNLCMFQINENYNNNTNNIKNLFNNFPNDVIYCINDNKTRNFLNLPNKTFTCEDTCYNEIIYTTEIIDTTYHIQTNKMIDLNIDNTTNYQTVEKNDGNSEITYLINSSSVIIDNTYNNNQTTTIKNNIIEYQNESIIDSNNNIKEYNASFVADKFDINEDIKILCDAKNNTYLYNYIIENILPIYNSNKGENMVFKCENNIVQITTQKNELDLIKNRSNNINNTAIVDLGQYEVELKTRYFINENDSLIIIKKEILSTKASEKSVNYEVYEPYNKTKLNLSYCYKNNFTLYVPIELSAELREYYERGKKLGYDIFNKNDPFYHDICTPFDSLSNTDILLCDRVDYIYYHEDIQCQSNCYMSKYSVETKYLECICSPNDKDIYENKKSEQFKPKKFYKVFYDVLRYSNYDIFKCYKLVLNINVVTNNIGSIFVILCFLFYLVCLFYYAFRKLIPLRNQLENDLKKLNIKNDRNFRYNIIDLFFPPIKKKSNVNKVRIVNKNIIKKKVRNIKSKINKPKNKKSSKDSISILSVSRDKKNIVFNFNFNNSDKFSLINESKFKPKSLNIKKNEEYSDFELNELEYKEATKKDKRSLCEIYWANLKREHLIIFTFFNCNDYNLLSIKLCRFIFLFVGDMAFNVFFFSDDSMHKLFISYGKYDFVQQIPQMIYSIIISQIIEVFLCFLSLTDKYIYQLKSNLKSGKYNKDMKNVIKVIKIKLAYFFVFTFLFLILYWYIISVFCAVYRNTQLIFIKDSLYSFGIGLVYPLFFYFISAIFRICALRDAQKNSECLYKFSDLIPLF